MQIGVSVVAVVVKTECLALTAVVTICQCCEMNVKEEQCVAIKFCCKVNFSATKTGTDSEGLRLCSIKSNNNF